MIRALKRFICRFVGHEPVFERTGISYFWYVCDRCNERILIPKKDAANDA